MPEHRVRDFNDRPWWHEAVLTVEPADSNKEHAEIRKKYSRITEQSDDQQCESNVVKRESKTQGDESTLKEAKPETEEICSPVRNFRIRTEAAKAFVALERLNDRSPNLSAAQLEQAVFDRADLSGVNLSGANLIKADLIEADLIEADLSAADLSRANISRAHLSGTFLSWADLNSAILIEANLSGVNLSGADLGGAILLRSLPTTQSHSWDRLRDRRVRHHRFANPL